MKLNWKRFVSLFVLFNAVLLMTGCTASWIGVAQSLLPAISAAVSALLSFIMSLQGKTVPASVTTAIQKITDDVNTELQNVATLISEVQAGGATVISQIGAALNGVVSNLSSILSGLSITDSATVQKITELVGLAVAAVQAILAIVPLAKSEVSEAHTDAELEVFDKTTARQLGNAHKAMQDAYKVVVTTPTENMDVNSALEALPQTLP